MGSINKYIQMLLVTCVLFTLYNVGCTILLALSESLLIVVGVIAFFCFVYLFNNCVDDHSGHKSFLLATLVLGAGEYAMVVSTSVDLSLISIVMAGFLAIIAGTSGISFSKEISVT